jgi:hypothetical protein
LAKLASMSPTVGFTWAKAMRSFVASVRAT